MNIIDRLERKWGKYAIENLTYYLIGGQVLAFLLIMSNLQYARFFTMQGSRIMAGQWWLIITFLFNPVSTSPIFVIFVWYIFYLYGSALERRWGSFKYLIYILISYIATVALAFVFPNVVLTNGYLYASLFLAFAYLFPEFQLLLFFIIPVKIKWLALLTWVGIIGTILLGEFSTKILAVVSISNFLFFFWSDLMYDLKQLLKQRTVLFAKSKMQTKAYHICAVCGDNEIDNPEMQIRYCSKCMPSTCYCENHIKNHVHIRKPN